jgi:hypothetical protein
MEGSTSSPLVMQLQISSEKLREFDSTLDNSRRLSALRLEQTLATVEDILKKAGKLESMQNDQLECLRGQYIELLLR